MPVRWELFLISSADGGMARLDVVVYERVEGSDCRECTCRCAGCSLPLPLRRAPMVVVYERVEGSDCRECPF